MFAAPVDVVVVVVAVVLLALLMAVVLIVAAAAVIVVLLVCSESALYFSAGINVVVAAELVDVLHLSTVSLLDLLSHPFCLSSVMLFTPR